MKKRYIYVPQVDENDCGVAALSMILKNFGANYSLAYLRSLTKTGKDGTTALGIVKAAQILGLETNPVKSDMTIFEEPTIKYPFIVHVVKEKNLNHYCVITNSTKDYVDIYDPDPSVRVRRISKVSFEDMWSGIAIFFGKTQNFETKKKSDENAVIPLFAMLLKKKTYIFWILLSAIIVTCISIIGSYFVQTIVDTLIPNKMIRLLSILSVGLLVFYIFQGLFNYIQNIALTVLSQQLSKQIILKYLDHVFKLPMDFFSTRKTGEIVTRFSDSSKIVDALSSTVISFFLDLVIAILVGGVLFIQSKILFLITVIYLPFYATVILTFSKSFEKINQQEMESNAQLNSTIIEDLKGIETIKTLRGEKKRFSKIGHQLDSYLSKNLKYYKLVYLQDSLKLFLEMSLTTFILWIGSNNVMNRSMTLGKLMTFVTLLAFFVSSLQSIIGLQPKIKSAKIANNRLNEIYSVHTEFEGELSPFPISHLIGPIKINNISLGFNYGKDVLQNVSLNIKNNEKIAIVGESGSGKSTLVKLLVGFYTPDSGDIRFNGNLIEKIDKKSIRKYVNYLPQNPYIFSGSVYDNLIAGRIDAVSNEEIISACNDAKIYDDIINLPNGINTILDEGASILSGGQKQRLAIARSILSNAHVLIFDESTSALDPITEKIVLNNIFSKKEQTIIFVAHKMAIARIAKRVLVLSNGKIVEGGSHDELMKERSYYYNLFNSLE